jgi:uncharacterized protein
LEKRRSRVDDITVIKLNILRQETWRYPARTLTRGPEKVVVEAFFNRPDTPFHGLILGEGDRFVEGYFTRRWYNIFEIHDREDDHLKGWYCNIAMPAEMDEATISYVDLALDLLVFPDGKSRVLDEDEFELLALDDEITRQARSALIELQRLVSAGRLSPWLDCEGVG